jgi:hypothetical protein
LNEQTNHQALPTGLISDDDASADVMEDNNNDDHSIESPGNDSLYNGSIFNDTATAVEFNQNGPTTPASEGEKNGNTHARLSTSSQTKRTDTNGPGRSYY